MTSAAETFRRIFFPLLCLLLLGPLSAIGAALEIPMKVINPLEQARWNEPVVSGIPLPDYTEVTDPADLMVVDSSGLPLPAQIRPLARRGPLDDPTVPIRWAEVIFQPTLSPGSAASFTLTEGSFSGGSLFLQEDGSQIVIGTGTRTFIVSRTDFDLFSTAGYEGKGLVIVKGEKTYRSGLPDEVTVEERGPLRACIKVTGRFYDAGGDVLVGGDGRPVFTNPAGLPIEYRVRLYFFAERDEVKLEVTLMNNGNGLLPFYPMNDFFLDGFYLEHGIPHDEANVTYAQTVTTPIDPAEDTFRISQGYSQGDREVESFFYRVVKNDQLEDGGNRLEGYASLNQAGRGVTVGLKNFWQKWPKSFEIEEGNLRVGLLPEYDQNVEEGPYGAGNHYFSGGWHSTDEILYRFHDGQDDPSQTWAAFTSPLTAVAPPAWYAETEAWGLMAPEDSIPPSPELAEAFRRYGEFAAMPVAPAASVEQKDLQGWREERALGVSWYKWEHFGCIPWDEGFFSMLHYDWAYGMWLQFLRTGDPEYYRLAELMTNHSSDFDQIHQGDPNDGSVVGSFSGMWWWETGGPDHHKSLNTSGWESSHTWNGAYALGYLLTGNRRYLEAADLGARFGRQTWSAPVAGVDVVNANTRGQGWSILMLLNRYKITGDGQDLQDALNLFRHATLYTEQQPEAPGSGGGGYITYDDGYYQDEMVYATYATYHLEPLCELHDLAWKAGLEVEDLESFLIRSLSWLKDYAYGGGVLNEEGLYSYLTLSYLTDPEDPEANEGGELAHNIHVAGAFGYGWTMLREKNPALAESYLRFARQLFRDLMYYRTPQDAFHLDRTWDSYYDPELLSPIEWGWLPTASKELGWLYRGGQMYFHAEYRQPAVDVLPPLVEAFALPETSTSLQVPILALEASDNVGVTGYWTGESAQSPAPDDQGWSSAAPPSYTFASEGEKTLCARARDAQGNISPAACQGVTVDVTPPVVDTFGLPRSSTSLTVRVRSFSARDNLEVTGYLLTESPAPPDPRQPGWSPAPPTEYTFDSAGTKTLYAWARDRVGNVSAGIPETVRVFDRRLPGRVVSVLFQSLWNLLSP